MKKIMIDMDDVICDGGFIALLNMYMGTNYTEKDIKSYYVEEMIPEEKKQGWKEFLRTQNIYDYVKFVDNAYEVMEKLSKKYDLYVLTAYVMKTDIKISGQVLEDKYNWLLKEIPFIKPENYIFTNSKDVVLGDIRIDDKLSNLECSTEKKLLFTAYHNKNINDEELKNKNVIRVNGWKDIEKLLM